MRIRKIALDLAPGLSVPGPVDTPEEASRCRISPRLLQTAIRQELTPRQRQCVELYYFRQLTMEEIGKELGIGKATVCRHLQKSKVRLGRALGYAAFKP